MQRKQRLRHLSKSKRPVISLRDFAKKLCLLFAFKSFNAKNAKKKYAKSTKPACRQTGLQLTIYFFLCLRFSFLSSRAFYTCIPFIFCQPLKYGCFKFWHPFIHFLFYPFGNNFKNNKTDKNRSRL